jgi:hypothetical protein
MEDDAVLVPRLVLRHRRHGGRYFPRVTSAAATDVEVAPGGVGRQVDPGADDREARRDALVVAAVSAAFSAVFIWRASSTHGGPRFTLFDDAMISMTYGRNLARGAGAVWNAGQPAVEGYTNPLWTLYMAGLHRAGLSGSGAALAVQLTSAVLLIGIALGVMRVVRLISPDARREALAAGLMCALFYPLAFWSLRGMEVGLFTALAVALAILVLRAVRWGRNRPLLLALVVASGLLTRTDFVVPVVAVLLWVLWKAGARERWRVGGPIVLAAIVTLALSTCFRLAYYGSALPNTYYLKLEHVPLTVRLSRGALVLVSFTLVGALVLVILTAAAYRWRPAARAEVLLLAMAGAAMAAYGIYVGGDAWESFAFADRYLVPAMVLLLPASALGIAPLVDWLGRGDRLGVRTGLVGAVVVALAAVWPGLVAGSARVQRDLQYAPTSWRTVVLVGLVAAASVMVAAVVAGAGHGDPRGRMFVVLATAVGLALSLPALTGWWTDGAPAARADAYQSDVGRVIGRITDAQARVGVVWAGAPIYYADRAGVDLLGKSDPVIAHERPQSSVPFWPGHDKWDYAHSIGGLRPDVINQRWLGMDRARDMAALGYVKVRPIAARVGMADPPILYARRGSPHVRWDLVTVLR